MEGTSTDGFRSASNTTAASNTTVVIAATATATATATVVAAAAAATATAATATAAAAATTAAAAVVRSDGRVDGLRPTGSPAPSSRPKAPPDLTGDRPRPTRPTACTGSVPSPPASPRRDTTANLLRRGPIQRRSADVEMRKLLSGRARR
ncbi:hypothetical protein [Nonomuraea sp. NPDC002799]